MARNLFDFSGRNALVTGCGSDDGIGYAAARLLGRLGGRVAITSTTAERIEARADELRGDGAEVPRTSPISPIASKPSTSSRRLERCTGQSTFSSTQRGWPRPARIR